jgi:hypothetical protein
VRQRDGRAQTAPRYAATVPIWFRFLRSVLRPGAGESRGGRCHRCARCSRAPVRIPVAVLRKACVRGIWPLQRLRGQTVVNAALNCVRAPVEPSSVTGRAAALRPSAVRSHVQILSPRSKKRPTVARPLLLDGGWLWKRSRSVCVLFLADWVGAEHGLERARAEGLFDSGVTEREPDVRGEVLGELAAQRSMVARAELEARALEIGAGAGPAEQAIERLAALRREGSSSSSRSGGGRRASCALEQRTPTAGARALERDSHASVPAGSGRRGGAAGGAVGGSLTEAQQRTLEPGTPLAGECVGRGGGDRQGAGARRGA